MDGAAVMLLVESIIVDRALLNCLTFTLLLSAQKGTFSSGDLQLDL